MARSLSNAKLLVVSFSDALSLSVFRRGYAATGAQGSVSGKGGSRSGILEIRAAMKEESGASTAWAPDPLTGYYRPQNRAVEIDPVELRNMLLNPKVRRTV
ncbi:hypothetical protein Dsin_029065 [Dipteronia sinensis]|uniref:Late embryogenesis abundant protein Lea5 n=1 Tax=Dipteronia sinensis TaxID=43782 RepID=A0AAE0DV65_9ROSI|nr:hypothetical protein Dsin_029065 [Dipteronia sinensis]